jgi:hypothetical protein
MARPTEVRMQAVGSTRRAAINVIGAYMNNSQRFPSPYRYLSDRPHFDFPYLLFDFGRSFLIWAAPATFASLIRVKATLR